MSYEYTDVKNLLIKRNELRYKINLIPIQGSIEIKENKSGKYIYARKKVDGKLTSTYVDKYDDFIYKHLIDNSNKLKALNKKLRSINKQLDLLGYNSSKFTYTIKRNIDYVKANLKAIIYYQSILEGLDINPRVIDSIVENDKLTNITIHPSSFLKIMNLKNAWNFLLDGDVLMANTSLSLLKEIAFNVNYGLLENPGDTRYAYVRITGTTYVPPLPNEDKIQNDIEAIISSDKEAIDNAIELCLYCMKSQIFTDGNKRASVIFANHYLIRHGKGFLVIQDDKLSTFKNLLIKYYEDDTSNEIKFFMKNNCIFKF